MQPSSAASQTRRTMRQDYTHESITATATGQTELGPVGIHLFGGTVQVVAVTARETSSADTGWNVNLGGNAIFSASQSVSSADTWETFIPDQNKRAAGENVSLEADVTASGTTGPLAMGVTLETVQE